MVEVYFVGLNSVCDFVTTALNAEDCIVYI